MDDSTIFADEIFGFHVQQAVEKLLKAWLALLGKAYPATHDLARLLEILKTCDTNVLDFADLTEYTSYAVRFRYSVSDHDATPLNRSMAVNRVDLLLDAVRSRMADTDV